MKKFKYLLMIIAVTFVLTGCVKFNATMDIKSDKSMDFSIIYAFDKTVFGEGNGLKEEDMAEAKKEGFTVTKYSEGNFEGFTLSKKIKNIDEVSTENDDAEFDLSGMMNENAGNKYIFKVVKGEDKNTYYAKLKFDSNDSGLNTEDDNTLADENDDLLTTTGDDSNSLDDMDLSKLMANLDLSFNVKLPNAAISSNATEKNNNNKNLTWKLTTGKTEYIEFAFEMSNKSNGMNMTVIGIVALIIVLVVLVLVMKNKKKNNNTVVNNTVTSDNNSSVTTEPESTVKE